MILMQQKMKEFVTTKLDGVCDLCVNGIVISNDSDFDGLNVCDDEDVFPFDENEWNDSDGRWNSKWRIIWRCISR